jgi:hypothetical protein
MASVTAAGQTTTWLLSQSESLVKECPQLKPQERDGLLTRLTNARETQRTRNRLVHDLWAAHEDGPHLGQSKRGTSALTFKPTTEAEMVEVAKVMGALAMGIHTWISETLGDEFLSLEAVLRLDTATRTNIEEDSDER